MPRKLSTAHPPEATALSLADARVWSALRKPFRWRLFEAVRASGGISAQDLARRAGITPQLMLYHLQLLERAGLVRHEAGKRFRGKGGKFRACVESLSLRTTRGNERRRADALLAALEEEARAMSAPDPISQSTVRWERLTGSEVRRIRAALSAIDSVLAEAAIRRSGDPDVPDATHVITASLRGLDAPAIPSPAWSSGSGRSGRSGRR